MDDFLTTGTPPILKVIVEKQRFNPEERDIKYIFIGEHTNDVSVLLTKIERGQSLSKEEESQLNNTLPYWKTKFGTLTDYKVKFINHIIPPNCITKHLILYLLDLENKRIFQQANREMPKRDWQAIIYSYPRVAKYGDIWELAAYLIFKLGDKQIGLKIRDIKTICKQLNIGDISIMNTIDDSVLITVEELIANKTFQEFYRSIPYLHGIRTYFNKEMRTKIYRELYSFEGTNLINNGGIPDSTSTESKSSLYSMAYDDQQIFMSSDDSRLEDSIDYTNTSTNNTLYFILAQDFTEHIKNREQTDNKIYTNARVYLSNLVAKFEKYTDEGVLLNMRNFNVYIQPGFLNAHSDNTLNTLVKDGKISKSLMTTITNDSILNIQNIEQRSFVWSGYDIGIGMNLDLINIFKDIEPNIFLPLIKYVSDGEVQLYNIYKPFFRNIDDKQKLVYLAGKDQILSLNENINSVYDRISVKRLKHLINLDYLVFKWRLDDTNIMNVYLFETGFIICEFQTPGYINFAKAVDLSGITNKILGKIKDKYKLNLDLPALNPEKLIKQTPGVMSYCDLINIKYKITFDLIGKVVNGYKSWDQLFGLFDGSGSKSANILNTFIDKLKLQHNVIVLPGTFDERIKFIYTNTYGFYSNDNIKHYIRNYMTKKNNKLTKADRELLIGNIQKIFNIDTQSANKLISELETLNLQTNHSFLFHVYCELELNKTDKTLKLLVDCANMNGYDMIKNILAMVDVLLKDSIFNTEFVVKFDKGKQIGEKKDKGAIAKLDIMDLDLENMDLSDLENIDFADFAEFNVTDIPLDTIDIDMDIVDKLQRIEEEKELAKVDDKQQKDEVAQQPLQDIKLKQLVGRKEKMSVANYMKDMRRRFDQELFEPTVKGKKTNFIYESSCPRTQMRQPFIITKEKLAQIEAEDPEAITGYLKYRGNYYICPRIWDTISDKPISARRFIANGLRSPTGGQSILEGPSKTLITDKYNVIIRQPTSDKYWSDSAKHKDWPSALKRTEKDAFPGLLYSNKHPNKCAPCCGINEPDDYDPAKKEIQAFAKPFNYNRCNYKPDTDDIKGVDGKDDDKGVGEYCKSDDYISNGSTTLKNCRLGLLPEELNLLLNNNQELFMNPTETGINDGANVFLRRGVQFNNITTILETFANILELRTDKLISMIINKLTPVEFIELNNGSLVNIFANSSELPVTPGEHERFRTFLKLYGSLLEYMNIDGEHIIDVLESKDFAYLSQAKLLYKICTGFYNYLGYINSPNESKNIDYIIDLFAKPRKWLPFKSGVNILIFNKTVTNINCLDTFNYKSKQLVIFIEEEPDTFVPIVHVTNKFGKLSATGIIELNESINLTNAHVSQLYKQKPTLTKLIESSKDRLNSIIKLLYIQSGLCNYNLTNFTSKLTKALRLHKLNVIHQYQGIGNAAQVEYINIDNTIILPVYPACLIKGVIARDYTEMHDDIGKYDLTYETYIHKVYEELTFFMDYGYKVHEIILDKIDNEQYVCGVGFTNGLSVSVKPSKFNAESFGVLRAKIYNTYGITMRVKQQYTLNLLKIRPTHINNKSVTDSIFNLLSVYNEIIKNNLSQYISSKNGKDTDMDNNIKEIIKCLDSRENKSIYSLMKHLHNILHKHIVHVRTISFMDFINTIISAGITKTNKEQTRKVVSNICHEQKTKKHLMGNNNTDKYELCMRDKIHTGKGSSMPKINITDELYPLLLLSVTNDLINNHIDSDKIVKGKYIIPINDMFLTRLGTGSLNLANTNTNNLIISNDELSFFLSKNIISKYKKNYKLDIESLELKVITSLSEDEMTHLKEFVFKDINQKLTSALGLASILSSYDSSSTRASSADKENQVIATPFNSSGLLNPNTEYGVCKFPFRDRKGKVNYKCAKAKDVFKTLDDKHVAGHELICPISLNKDKTVKTWGYCPEKPNVSKQRLQPAPLVDAFDPENPDAKIGTCSFPFIYHNKKVVNPLSGTKPLIKLSFGCEDKTKGTWCYTRPIEANRTPLIGAIDLNNIYKGEWSMAPIIPDNKHGTVNITGKHLDEINESIGYKEGMCTFKIDAGALEKIEKHLDLVDVKQIASLEEYNPNYCKLGDSKKGYSKKQLYLFGKNILNIPYRHMLNKNNTILNKPELCDMFNNKIRDIKKAQLQINQTDLDYSQIYTKDPMQCKDGETKGGYKFTELRDMAITFFGLDEEKAKGMLKDDLCDYIIPIISGKSAPGTTMENKSDIISEANNQPHRKFVDPDDIYPASKNINLCDKPIKRGGLQRKDVTNIAMRYFGIEDASSRPKEELCGLIKEGIEKIKTENSLLDKEDKQLVTRKDAPKESVIVKKVDLLKDMKVDDLNDIKL
jgi:hypothetical protein